MKAILIVLLPGCQCRKRQAESDRESDRGLFEPNPDVFRRSDNHFISLSAMRLEERVIDKSAAPIRWSQYQRNRNY